MGEGTYLKKYNTLMSFFHWIAIAILKFLVCYVLIRVVIVIMFIFVLIIIHYLLNESVVSISRGEDPYLPLSDKCPSSFTHPCMDPFIYYSSMYLSMFKCIAIHMHVIF